MLRPNGHLAMFAPDVSRADQHDTIMCGHCQRVIKVKPGFANLVYLISRIEQWVDPVLGKQHQIVTVEKPAAQCRLCMRKICHPCNGKRRCDTWERKIDAMEAKGRRLKAMGLASALWLVCAPTATAQVFGGEVMTGIGSITTVITAPTSSSTYDAGTSTDLTTLAGTATPVASTVTGCTWTNDAGGSGSATGTTSWSVAVIALTIGENRITVTCTNDLGQTGADILTVTRDADLGDENPIDGARLIAGDATVPNPTWALSGVTGGIPARTTICQTLGTAGQVRTFAQSVTATQINTAITNCTAGQTVLLETGTYTLTAGISFGGRSNVTLRGEGPDSTLLKFPSGGNGCHGFEAAICVGVGNLSYYGPGPPSNSATWTAGYTQGATSVTLSNTTGLSVGRWIVLDQLNDTSDPGNVYVCSSCSSEGGTINGRTNRAQRQWVQIVSCTPSCPSASSTVVTISEPLHMPNWRSAQTPGAYWGSTSGMSSFNGIENLSIDTLDSLAEAPVSSIGLMWAADSWVKNVRSLYAPSPRSHIMLYAAMHATIRDSYFYGNFLGGDSGGSQNYGINVYGGGGHLIENNMCQHRTPCLMANGDSGSVWAYNFSIDSHYTASAQYMQADMYSHEAGNAMILREGNSGVQINSDIVHGSSNLFTYFRNYVIGWETGKTESTVPVKLYAFSRYHNLVGNVFGRTGYHTNYGTGEGNYTSIYMLGVDGGNPGGDDPIVATSLLRWANWDTVTSTNDTGTNDQTGTRCVSSESPSGISYLPNPVPTDCITSLPSSLYLAAKPSWWGDVIPWPSIGPDVTSGDVSSVGGHVWKNPAQVCWESLADDTAYSADSSGRRPKRYPGCW